MTPTREKGCKTANTCVSQDTENPGPGFSTALVTPCQRGPFLNRCPCEQSWKTSGTWSVQLEVPRRFTAMDLKAQGSKAKAKVL